MRDQQLRLRVIGPLAGLLLVFQLVVPSNAEAGYSASPTSTTTGGGTWGSILRMSVSISVTQATFTITKQSGTFTSSGTMYLKEGSPTGTTRASKSVSAGASSVSIPLTLSSLTGYPKSFYARYESSAGGHAYVGPITISFTNSAPSVPSISSSPSSVLVGNTVSISVTRGTDPNGDRVKVRCTAQDSNRTDASPYDSGFGTAGTSATATFTFSAAGTKTIWCASFDEYGAGGQTTAQRTISVTANRPPSTPTISSSPGSAIKGVTVSVAVTRGTDPDGDRVKVRCTAQDSDRFTTPWDSGFGTGGTSATATFTFSASGIKTIWCSSFDELGAGGQDVNRTIDVQNPSASGSFSSPSGTIVGPVTIAASASATAGLKKVSMVFVPFGDPYVLCEDNTSNPCQGTSESWNEPGIDPRWYSATPGSLPVGLWVRDDLGNEFKVSERTINWQPASTGSLTSPLGSGAGIVTVTANATAQAGLQKVSVVFVPHGTPLVLCDDSTTNRCVTGSWSKADVNPRDYSVPASGTSSLTLGLWVLDDLGRVENVDRKAFTWQPVGSGSFSSPGSGTVTGPVDVAVSASATQGMRKVSVVFNNGGPNLVLCDDATSTSCTGSTWQRSGVDPRDYGVQGSGPVTLGLWIRDDQGRTDLVATRSFTWQESSGASTGTITSPIGSFQGNVTVAANAADADGLRKVSVVFVPGGPPLVLCDDSTSSACLGTSGSWTRSEIDPRIYGVTQSGTVTLGLWVEDERGNTTLVHQRSFTWTLPTPIYLNVSDWAQSAAHYLVTNGIVTDPANHDLRGTSDAPRVDLATMIYRALGGGQANADARFSSWYGGSPTPRFIDVVDPTVWYYKPVSYLGGLELGDGITVFDQGLGIFRPANTISRAWTVKALLEAWGLRPLTSFSGIPLFNDVPTTHPAAGYIYRAWQEGIVTGTNNLFQPDAAADRQDIFVLLHRLLDAQANVYGLTIAPPTPLSRDDFAPARPLRRIGARYEQPIVAGARVPTVTLTATALARETIGALAGIYTSTLQATLSGVDDRTFVDSRGITRQAHPFCAWSATSGSFVDLTPSGAVPFSRVRWLAPADVSAASGNSADFEITVYCGDNLGHEVRASRLLSLSSLSDDSTLPVVSLSALPTGKIGGQFVEIRGTAQDGGNSSDADYGILRVEIFYSLDNGSTWARLGEAPLDAQGGWQFRWVLPSVAGNILVRARATNLRGNSAQAQRSLTVAAALAIEGAVVDGRGEPLENALVTLTGGGLNVSQGADNQGSFRFSNAAGTALSTGVSYTLTASFGGQSASAGSLVLTSQAPSLYRVLVLDTAPPTTAASVPGGAYGAPQSVELFCMDDSSGCSATYYTTNGSTPDTSSPRYSAPIPVAQSMTLKFFSLDAAGNREAVVSETYVISTCTFVLGSAGQFFGAAGGSGSVAVTAPGGCAWTASAPAGWLTITAGASGLGNGTVSFSVAPNPGVSSRTGDLSIAGQTFTVVQDGTGTPTFSLTVQTAGLGSGRVWSTPAGIDCPADCTESYTAGTAVHLTAEAHPGSVFAGWSGAGCSGTGSCTVNLDAAREVMAVFEEEVASCFDGWVNVGPSMGEIRRLAIEPSQPLHLYAATGGGVFESFDGGGSWRPTGLDDMSVEDLVLDPLIPSRLYAITRNSFWASDDGGETWQERRSGLPNGNLRALALAPDPATLFIGNYDTGIYRSVDGGFSWTLVKSLPLTSIQALRVDPMNPEVVYAGIQPGGLLKSTDGGSTWSTVLSGPLSIYAIEIDPRNSSVLHIATTSGIERSTDGGSRWTSIFLAWLTALAQAPGDSSVLYAGSADGMLWKSGNGGSTWAQIGAIADASFLQTIAVSPSSASTIFVGASGRGILKSTNGGTSWQEANSGLFAANVSAPVLDPAHPETLLLANHGGGGVFRSLNTGDQWTLVGRPPLRLVTHALKAASAQVLYVLGHDGLFKSSDGGSNWTNITGSLAGRSLTRLDLSTQDPNRVYVGTYDGGVFRSTDGGVSWSLVTASLNSPYVVSLAVDPRDPLTVYVAVGHTWGQVTRYKSTNGGSSWSQIATVLPSAVTDLRVDPSNSSRLLAAGYLDLYESEDGGNLWRRISVPPGWVTAVAPHPADPTVLFLAMQDAMGRAQIFRSTDHGDNWSAWSEGLAAPWVNGLTLVGELPATLYAATAGRSVYRRIECPEASLSVTKAGTGTGRVTSVPAGIDCGADCAETVPEGTAVTFVAQPDAGSVFSGWSEAGCFGTGTCHVAASGSVAVTATFTRLMFPLTVSVTGSGRVMSQPAGIDCGTDCAESFAAGASVTLTALPTTGSVFSGWGGAADCADGQISVNGPVSCTATFVPGEPAGGDFYSLAPCRILDTRTTSEPLAASLPRSIQIAGLCGVPVWAKAIAANVTVFQPSVDGWVTLWPAGIGYTGTFTNTFKAGEARANNAVLPLGIGGLTGQAFLPEGGTTHLIIDVSGYFD